MVFGVPLENFPGLSFSKIPPSQTTIIMVNLFFTLNEIVTMPITLQIFSVRGLVCQ